MIAALARLPLAPGDPVDRSAAREAARRELSKAIYHRDDPPLQVRLLRAVLRWLNRVYDAAAAASPGGGLGLLALVALVVIAVVVIRLRVGPLRATARLRPPLASDRPRTAAEHRAAADRFAAEQRWAEAVRERLRAVARDLETRGVLEPRAGRTAAEVAAEAGAALPDLAPELRAAAQLFDEIWYGGRAATADSDQRLRDLDDAVRRRAVPVAAGAR